MPIHLANHVARGGHVQGIFVVTPDYYIRELAEQIELIIGASLPDEFRDQIRYLPLWRPPSESA
jgi:hypothetical protein